MNTASPREGGRGTRLLAYVGTYSPKGGGIHRFALDAESGELRPLGLTPSTVSPSWIAFAPDGHRLYSANEAAGEPGQPAGSISAYAVDGCDGELRLLNTVASGGAAPAHLSLHPGGRHLFVANYGGGSVAVLPVLPDGRLAPATELQLGAPWEGAGPGLPRPQRAAHAPPGSFAVSDHDAPHFHMAASDPQGRFVVANDLGSDCTVVWRFEAGSGRLIEPCTVAASPGAGPRHFAWHRNGQWFYSLNEASSTLAFMHYDSDTGRLRPQAEVSTLPAGYAGSNYASGVVGSPDGRFLYCLNRLHDSIAIFSLAADGQPVLTGEEWSRGSYPRSCQLDPSGRFLYVCNQHSDNVTLFHLEAGGRLRFTGHYAAVGAPAVIDFLALPR